MITALAFRLKSRQAQYFREWIIEQALNPVILLENSWYGHHVELI